MDPKGLHDRLLEQMPPGAQHQATDCPWCTAGADTDKETASEDHDGRNGMTEAELKTALEAKNAENAELRKLLDDSKTESEFQAKIDAAVADVQAKYDDVQSKLDTAVLEAETERTKREALEAFLVDEAAKQDAAAAIAACRDERVTLIREATSFPESYLTENADRFAAMASDDFEKALADWKALSGDNTAGKGLPRKTALETARETANHDGSDVLREVMGLRFKGVDTREIASRGVR